MNTLQKLNTWMTPKMPLLILCALVLGLLFPNQVGVLCPAVTTLMMFQTFANSLGSSVQDLGRVLSHPKPVLITLFCLHILMPLVALGIGSVCFPDQPLYTLSLVLMEGSPAAVSSLMWIVIGGGSVELCLSIILLDTLLSPVVLPLTLRLLCGSVVELDTPGMIRDLFVMIVLQYGCVFLSGFLKSTKGVYSFTLQYWDQLWRIGSSTMLRSVEYALIVSIAGTVFAMLFAYYMDRRRILGHDLFDCLATLPYMLPGTCFGIGYILAFNHAPLKLTGTALIVLANMLFKQLPTSTKICTASLALLPEVQERSARDLGAGRLAVLRDVVFPALRPAFLSCFVYNFTSSMTTAGSIIFLIDAKRQLAVFKLFDAVYQGDYALASLIASVITVIVLLVEGLAFLITRKGENRRVSRT